MMNNTEKWLIWDFDGTLGFRHGGMWSGTLREIIEAHFPEMLVSNADVRHFIQRGYPWHTPEIAHPHLCDADAWWAALNPVFVRALCGVGVPEEMAPALATEFRARYIDLSYWRLFDDSLPMLIELSRLGWQHILLSNHVPELSAILQHLALTQHFHYVFNSAATGYEKPHPQAFHNVLEKLPAEVECWMIGDNYLADIAGAAQVSIPGILVRNSHPEARIYCADLAGIVTILAAQEN